MARERVTELHSLLHKLAKYAESIQERESVNLNWNVRQFVARMWWVTAEAIKSESLEEGATPVHWVRWPRRNPVRYGLAALKAWYTYMLPVFSGCPANPNGWADMDGEAEEIKVRETRNHRV